MKLSGFAMAILAMAVIPPTAAQASKPVAFSASMVVTGQISVSPKGSVTHYQLDKARKLPKAVVGMLNASIPNWRFKPVMQHDVAVPAHTHMILRILATPIANHRYRVSLASSYFGDINTVETLREDHVSPPEYPQEEALSQVQGTAYLLLRINREGRVDKVAAEQVNLRTLGTPEKMQLWRHDLARASIIAARRWTFKTPERGPEAKQPYWYAELPVEFGPSGDQYGAWYTYYPGPRQNIPWADSSQLARGSVDSKIPGRLYTGHQGLQRIASTHGAPKANAL